MEEMSFVKDIYTATYNSYVETIDYQSRYALYILALLEEDIYLNILEKSTDFKVASFFKELIATGVLKKDSSAKQFIAQIDLYRGQEGDTLQAIDAFDIGSEDYEMLAMTIDEVVLETKKMEHDYNLKNNPLLETQFVIDEANINAKHDIEFLKSLTNAIHTKHAEYRKRFGSSKFKSHKKQLAFIQNVDDLMKEILDGTFSAEKKIELLVGLVSLNKDAVKVKKKRTNFLAIFHIKSRSSESLYKPVLDAAKSMKNINTDDASIAFQEAFPGRSSTLEFRY